MVSTPRIRVRDSQHPLHVEGSPETADGPDQVADEGGCGANANHEPSEAGDRVHLPPGANARYQEGDPSDLDEELSEASLDELGALPRLTVLIELHDRMCHVGFRCKGWDGAYEMVACGRSMTDCRHHEQNCSERGRRKACGWYRHSVASQGNVMHGLMSAF